MKIPIDFRDEAALEKAFDYITRIGIGAHFPGMPIGWYQMHQCHALDALLERCQTVFERPGTVADYTFELRCLQHERVQARIDCEWKDLGTVREFYREADKRSRR